MAERLTCIVCPLGCALRVEVDGGSAHVTGNQCARGLDYGRQEALDPRRTVCSTVFVRGGSWPIVSVRTSEPVPRARIMDVMGELKKTVLQAPVEVGRVVITNVAGTGADVVATRCVDKG